MSKHIRINNQLLTIGKSWHQLSNKQKNKISEYIYALFQRHNSSTPAPRMLKQRVFNDVWCYITHENINVSYNDIKMRVGTQYVRYARQQKRIGE